MLAMPKECAATMISVKTLLKGVIEVPEDRLITFTRPLLGFDSLKRFLLYQTAEGPMYWLQSVEDERTAFCLLAPFLAGLDPDLVITPADAIDIQASGSGDIDVYTVVVLDRDPALVRTNLRAPVLIGRTSGKAKQVVLEDPRLPIRFFLKDLRAR
jgi:flagellar assembly factor FliW